jgi:hypothetical protein
LNYFPLAIRYDVAFRSGCKVLFGFDQRFAFTGHWTESMFRRLF